MVSLVPIGLSMIFECPRGIFRLSTGTGRRGWINPGETKPKSIKRMQRNSAAFLVIVVTNVTIGLLRVNPFTLFAVPQ